MQVHSVITLLKMKTHFCVEVYNIHICQTWLLPVSISLIGHMQCTQLQWKSSGRDSQL